MKLQGLYFDCHIDGVAAQTFNVTEFHLEEGLSQLFTLTLTLVSARADVDVKTVLLLLQTKVKQDFTAPFTR